MDNPKQQIVDRLKQANSILVTVSNNPSVDQLAACIGLTLLLNKLDKHSTAVFSGAVPSTLEFLEPEKTIETNTDSLRDFIIALDKSKADKLRYKVEDKVVRIFITPYRTSISEKDLEFSQGDFNVEVIMALGVREQQDLDQAIAAHGRILHDATIVSVNTTSEGKLGTIHWQDTHASSLCEMIAGLGESLDKDKKLLDNQIATALLTGIVSETNRFSNNRTTPTTMSLSATLMAAGANQQLVATKLQEGGQVTAAAQQPIATAPVGADTPSQQIAQPPKAQDGTLEIDHPGQPVAQTPPAVPGEGYQVRVNEAGELLQQDVGPTTATANQPAVPAQPAPTTTASSRPLAEPPSLSGTLTANSRPEALDPSTDPLSVSAKHQPLLQRSASGGVSQNPSVPNLPSLPAEPELPFKQQAPPTVIAPSPDKVIPDQPSNSLPSSPVTPAQPTADTDVNMARNAVEAAINAAPVQGTLPPIQALGAQPVFEQQAVPGQVPAVNENPPSNQELVLPPAPSPGSPSNLPLQPAEQAPNNLPQSPSAVPEEQQLDTLNMPAPPATFPTNLVSPVAPPPSSSPNAGTPHAPPPVPPPMPLPPANNG